MIRVAVYLIIVGVLAFGAAWLADRPGEVVVTWQGWRLETSVMVLCAALLAALAVLLLLWSLLRLIWRSPFLLRTVWRNRRGERAYAAISRGLIAVGAGDAEAARKSMLEANRIAAAEPLALLLSAQAAQLAGDREAADRAFRTMASRADTKTLGLHGLFVEAQRRDDIVSARAYAEEAARVSATLGWAGRAVLEFRCATDDWAGALALLERGKRALGKDRYQRQRAVMLTARALAAEETDRDNAKASALEAVKLAPTLVPAAALAGRLLADGGDPRKAARVIEKAWRANPHPELAQAYADVRSGDTARDRLKRIEALAKKAPGHVEGALATARAAIDAHEFAKARAALTSHLKAPTRRVALLMAALERAERSDEGRAREWMARALHAAPDPAWTADGHVSDRWLPLSPADGRLDAFEWRVPITGIPGAPAIEPEPSHATPLAAAPPPPPAESAPPAGQPGAAQSEATEPLAPSRRRIKPTPPKPEPVIPLVHAPDDPGPEAVEEHEPHAEPQDGGWRKLFE
jgi:HemY protein